MPTKEDPPQHELRWLRRASLAVASIVSLVATLGTLNATGVRLYVAGQNTLTVAWPTLIAVGILLILQFREPPSATPRKAIEIVAAIAWIASSAVYFIGTGETSLGDVTTALIIAGVPIFVVFIALAGMRRALWPRPWRLIVGGALGLFMATLTLPMALLWTCFLTGRCL